MRRFSLFVVWVWVALLLCQCAAKHQTREFPAYFPIRPQSHFDPSQLREREKLEALLAEGRLDRLGKKRLWELTAIELRLLKAGSDREQRLRIQAEALYPEIRGLEEEVADRRSANDRYRETKPASSSSAVFGDPALRRAYMDAYQLWNQDVNDQALAKVNEILAGELFEDASSRERFKLFSMRFRIALDLNDLETAQTSYLPLREIDECAPETAQAGFLMALHRFAVGDVNEARRLFDNQCDPDQTPANLTQRKYWRARFYDDAALFDELARAPLPGYYSYLTKARLGRPIDLPKGGTIQFPREFEIGRTNHSLLEIAEQRLAANLKRDAGAYLLPVSRSLRADLDETTVGPLLYTAHLLHAAGSHLEAIKIYSDLSLSPLSIDPSFLPSMFPRPFAPAVEWAARLWKVDPDLLYAIMRQESAFNPGAVSPADARGLMQLMPSLGKALAARWRVKGYSDKLLFHAEENLKFSAFHLYQLDFIAPHPVLMIGAYNAGITRTAGWWRKFGNYPMDVFIEMIPVNETRNYIKIVLRNLFFYKALRQGGHLSPDVVPPKLPPHPSFGLAASRPRP